jgi:glycosyltransferase involved in cell wall biosynthesis
LQQEFSKIAKRVEVITNGYDEEVPENQMAALDTVFSISYIGLLPNESNPKVLFEVLRQFCIEIEDFKKDLQLNFIGDIAMEVKAEIRRNGLEENTSFLGYVSHQKAIAYQCASQVLLLLIPNVKNNKGILTGKLFEYLAAKRPILALGPEEGDLATILKESNAGVVVAYDNQEKLKLEIYKSYQAYKENCLGVSSISIEKYHRKELTKNLAVLLKNLNS